MGNPHHENVCEAMAGQYDVNWLTNLADRLRQEAQIHAGEARAANATIYKIYRCVTQGTGEPGNWNGAAPVIAEIERLRAERDHWRGLVSRADTALFPFPPASASSKEAV